MGGTGDICVSNNLPLSELGTKVRLVFVRAGQWVLIDTLRLCDVEYLETAQCDERIEIACGPIHSCSSCLRTHVYANKANVELLPPRAAVIITTFARILFLSMIDQILTLIFWSSQLKDSQ